jgi:hypothetical protein
MRLKEHSNNLNMCGYIQMHFGINSTSHFVILLYSSRISYWWSTSADKKTNSNGIRNLLHCQGWLMWSWVRRITEINKYNSMYHNTWYNLLLVAWNWMLRVFCFDFWWNWQLGLLYVSKHFSKQKDPILKVGFSIIIWVGINSGSISWLKMYDAYTAKSTMSA